MARFYADEQFPRQVVVFLRELGHDVLTTQEAGNQGMPDDQILVFATRESRTVLTLNRRHFVRLHRIQPDHAGIVVCTRDDQWERQAGRIDRTITVIETLENLLIRVNRPG